MIYVGNPKSCISESLKVLGIQKKSYVGGVDGGILMDHFMSIEHGLQFLLKVLEVSQKKDLKLRIQQIAAIVKEKLHSFSHNQEGENMIVKLEHAYGELRDEMQNVVVKPGTDDYHTLFPEILEDRYFFSRTKDFLLEEIRILGTSSCKADKIVSIMRELEELWKKLTSLKPLFDYVEVIYPFSLKDAEEKIMAALTSFLNTAACLIYLSFIGKLSETMLVSVRKNFYLLIEETEIKEMCLVLGIIFKEDLEPDISLSVWEDAIDLSLSLLKRQEEYYMGTIHGADLKDHITSLKHGIEFLKWLPKFYIDDDLEQHIILLAKKVKQKIEWLTYKPGDESMNRDVNDAYADLREDMKNLNISPTTNRYNILFQYKFILKAYLRSNNDFLVEKITTLVTSNCKADQIASLKKELQDLDKLLTFLKPLDIFVDHNLLWLGNRGDIFATLLSVHQRATFPLFLSYIGKMDIEMVLSIKSNISTTIKETNVFEMYNVILNDVLFSRYYLEEELYLIENVILLLKSNIKSLNDANSKLYEALVDMHIFLLGRDPNVLLRKLHLLQPSFQAVLSHSIPIVCSCYLEHTAVDVSAELNCVFNLIKHIKSEAQEIKLYYFPRVGDLGFLEFFFRYLEDLMKSNETSMKEEIQALHFEVQSLLPLAKVTNQEELNETPWTDIVNMAYQAEYIIDLYLASGCEDMGCISSLSNIIGQVKNIREDLQGLGCKSLPAQDVVATSKLHLGTSRQVSDNDAIVGLQEEAKIITEYLLKGESDNDAIVGLQEEAKIITDYLVKGEEKLDVISIVGMAGVGKTTLALSLYKIPLMSDHFDILAWCSVSQSYQNRNLLFSILDQVNAPDKDQRTILDDEALPDHFCKRLKKSRYLIVLDDIWDTSVWNYLKRYLPEDRKGSRILITTRNMDIAVKIGSKVNGLHGLSDEKSWELFQKKMFGKSLSDDLQKISKAIVKNCKGLPLSIVIIAGILSDVERTEKKWNQIAESVSSLILSHYEGECKAVLELSYNHLPNHLRSCFLYLGTFPEDKEISVNRLISLWIAEGLVFDTKSDSAEEVAKKYMEDLIVKSLVIPVKERSRGGVKTFRLHDLLRDFCLVKAKEMHFFTMLDQRNDSLPLQDPRRLIINGPRVKNLHFSCHSIRSMICFDELEASEIEIGILSCDMVLLQVLVVGEFHSKVFPTISTLVHLKYLALCLEDQEISILPSSISKLENLQIVILTFKYLIKVPDFIWDMVKLRHVDISPEASFEVDRNRLENSSFLLENLISLYKARVSLGDFKWLSKLSGLKRLSCVYVDDLEEVNNVRERDDDVEDNQFGMVSFNCHLTSLKVENMSDWEPRFASIFRLPTGLRELTLSKFSFKSNDFSKIVRPLKHLEVFKIYTCYLPSGYQWNVDDDDFPKLKVLKLRDLDISNWIASESSFPSLEQLWVEKCSSLDEIPLDFGYLPKLRLISVKKCAPSVDDSAREIKKLQHDDQNTEMRVRIHPKK